MAEINTPHKKEFDIARQFGKVSNYITYIVSIVSVILYFFDCAEIVKTISILSMSVLFVLNMISDLFLNSAENIRRKGLIDNSYGTNYNHQESIGYYDNDKTTKGDFKLLVNTFQSIYWTNEILKKMKLKETIKNLIIFTVLIIFAIYGFQQVKIATPILQIYLSSIFLGKVLKIWTYSNSVEKMIERIKLNITNKDVRKEEIISILLEYETTIAFFKINLDSRIYDNYNQELEKEWEKIKEKYNLNGDEKDERK